MSNNRLSADDLAEMAKIMCESCSRKDDCDHYGHPHWVALDVSSLLPSDGVVIVEAVIPEGQN